MYIIAADTDTGIKKNVNQDAVFIKLARFLEHEIVFSVICDGMGGLDRGEIASTSVLEACNIWFMERLPSLIISGITPEKIYDDLQNVIGDKNEELKSFGLQNGVSLGTTLTAFLIIDKIYYMVHVGDCRIYEITPEKMYILTDDQTVVGKEVKEGRMTEEDAGRDSRRNVLLQCIGASENVKPQFRSAHIRENCSYVLCSDGFRHTITGDEIGMGFNPKHFHDTKDVKDAIRHHIDLNKARMEVDNITAAVIVVK